MMCETFGRYFCSNGRPPGIGRSNKMNIQPCRKFDLILKPALVAVAVALTILPILAANTPAPNQKICIVLAGDSTVTDNAGWGKGFARCLATNVECINLSRGGRSSKSFIAEGLWQKCLDLKPDYVLIQFGHNDQPGHGPARETDPMTTYRQFMTQYVDEARAAGIKPVLVTSLSRRQWGDDGRIHSTLQPWVNVVKLIADEKHVPIIDLHARSIEFYEKWGREKILEISPLKNADAASTNSDTATAANRGYDGTHLNAKGSAIVGRMVAEELARAVPVLAPYIHTDADAAIDTATPTTDLVVAADGSGQFKTVQEAIDAAPTNSTRPFVICIKPGTYRQHLFIPADKPYVTLLGTAATNTILTGSNNVNTIGPNGKKLSTADSSTVLVRAENFTAENVTFEDTAGNHGQALAFYITGDRGIFRHCRFLGWQDTLRADAARGGEARQYFVDCEIVGHVDFIYAAATAVFDHCHIHCLADGYITAASTPQNVPFGYVFLNCRVTTEPTVTRTYLGRPWRPYAAVAFLNTELPAAIAPQGWYNWDNPTNELTARYAEYQSTGPGANPDARVKWAHQLTGDEARTYTVENVLKGTDGWNPQLTPAN